MNEGYFLSRALFYSVWVFVILRGKYWLPPLMAILGAWLLVSGVTELVSISRARKKRSGRK